VLCLLKEVSVWSSIQSSELRDHSKLVSICVYFLNYVRDPTGDVHVIPNHQAQYTSKHGHKMIGMHLILENL